MKALQQMAVTKSVPELQAFTVKGNDEFLADSMTEYVFSLRLWRSLFLVKLEAITVKMKVLL